MRPELGKDYYESMHRRGGVGKAYHVGARESYMFVLWEAINKKLYVWSTIAEFGCGAGQLASLIIERGLYYEYGVDIAEYGIYLAKQHNPKHEDKFYAGSIYVPAMFDIAPFNTAIFCEVLEHLEDDLKPLSYLPSGTRVIISVPNADSHEHVRFFETEESAREHYGKEIDIKEVEIVKMPINNPGNKYHWYIIDGVKR
jgi:SAM-dependent methyltransferase